MIKCSKCQATLPDGAGYCQFCGNTFAPQPTRRRDNDEPAYVASGTPKWVWPAYTIISVWWIISGVWGVAQGLMSKNPASFWVIVSMVISAVTALVGIGLLLRVELARGIVNVLCFLQIIDGGFGLLGSFMLSFVFGLLGAIAMIVSALRIAMGILMMFVIGETESRAPNF